LRRCSSPLCCGRRYREQQWREEMKEVVVHAWEIQLRIRREGKAR